MTNKTHYYIHKSYKDMDLWHLNVFLSIFYEPYFTLFAQDGVPHQISQERGEKH